MKRIILLVSVLFISTSCGSLKLVPRYCQTDGHWGDKAEKTAGVKEFEVLKDYYVWFSDLEVPLEDVFENEKIQCADIKKMRVEVKSILFVKRELKVFVSI